MSKVISVRVSDKTYERLMQIAGERSISEAIKYLITEAERMQELERQLLYITYLIEEDVRVRLLRSENFERYLEKVKERMKNEGY